jgi:predicted transcriptional regulator
MRNLETFETLPPVVEWLPGDEPTFDLRLLADATVVTADEGDLIAPIRRALELVDRSDRLRVIANGASREFTEAMRDAVEAGATHALVVPPGTVDALRSDSGLRTDIRAMLASGRGTLLQYEGETDLPVIQVGDESVALCSGDHRAMIETDDDAVHDWATSYFESLRRRSTPVPVEAFADDAALHDDSPVVE